MKKHLSLCLLAILFAASAFSQKSILIESPEAFSERLRAISQDFAPPPYASLSETLDAAFDSITALTPIKGFNAAMLLPDGTYWKRAKGVAKEIPAAAPLTTGHLMGMGSISKTFVAVALLLLVEEGKISLDDSIGRYIGPYPNVSGGITVRQLLSHRSGLNDYLNENPASGTAWSNAPAHIWTFDEILKGYVLEPNFAPGTAWSYSNTNYLLTGVLIEKLTGQPWYKTVRQKVIDPLGLSHTFVYPFETPGSQPLAHVFADLLGTGGVQDVQGLGFPDKGLFSLATSAGCLISTPEDLTRFVERTFGGHLLQPETLAEMETDYTQSTNGFLYGLGAVSFPVPQNRKNWGHDGDLIYKSVALYFPSDKMALAVQQNDDRNHDPADLTTPAQDVYDVFAALLLAYWDYTPLSATSEIAKTGFSVFPNPAAGALQIAPGEWEPVFPLSVALTDMAGRVVAVQLLENGAEKVDVRHLPAGVYHVRAGAYTNKVVIIK